MLPPILSQLNSTRRTFLGRATASVGAMALGTLFRPDALALAAAGDPQDADDARGWQGVVDPLHAAPRAKRIIHLYMAGGPSHLETFDHKPELAKRDGQPMPESFTKGQQIAQLQGQKLNCFAPQYPFMQYGQTGLSICSQFPKIGSRADDLCIIRSMQTDQINHDPAHTLFNTGSAVPGRPSMGSWLTYGLGDSTRDLPSFVVLTSIGKGGQAQPIAARQWASGFLPSRFQGVEFRSKGDPVLYVSNPPGIDRSRQFDAIEAVRELNRMHHDVFDDPEALTRIAQYELAYRMQMSVPELVDTSSEPREVLDMYGTEGRDGTFAGNCLLARRLAERGVRFIQVYHRAWDHHGGIKKAIEITAGEVDRATWALVTDLKQRGMLEDTLILFGGEFGRTPMAQGNGRDHHIKGYSYMLAGGGVKGGIAYGATDELGYNAVDNIVHIRHLHATIMHLMGIDHKRLSYKFQGLDVKLTGVEEAHVIGEILA
jgi:hypothetical protein